MIEIRDLQFRYSDSDFALQLPGLSIKAGEHTAIIGPSGCGKTTLLQLFSGVLLPDHGEMEVAGVQVSGLEDAARRNFRIRQLGMVFQSFELLDYLSVIDNILLPLRIAAGISVTPELRQRAMHLAEQVGIESKLNRHPGQLSQGERQRVAVCRALLLKPPLLLADEPTGNLDSSNKFLVLDLLLEHARMHDATLVAVTHDSELLGRFEQVLNFRELNRWQSP
jgi:putative ABC transport system ATP-binding protein